MGFEVEQPSGLVHGGSPNFLRKPEKVYIVPRSVPKSDASNREACVAGTYKF